MREQASGPRLQLKTCTKCKVEKPIERFSVDRHKLSGLCVRCKDCRRAAYIADKLNVAATSRRHYQANKVRHDKLSLAYYYAHRDHRSAKMTEWYRNNADLVSANVAAYRIAHPGFDAAKQARRRAQELRATPSWADFGAIKAIYAEAARLTLETGIPHHVDHKIPLQGRNVCGLHVAGNLQILTATENVSKSNKFEPFSEAA